MPSIRATFPAIMAPAVLLFTTTALIASTLMGVGLPGLGYDLVSLLGMAQLAFISGIVMTALPLSRPRPEIEIVGGLVLAASTLLHAHLYTVHGPGHPVSETLELIYFWGLALASAGLIVKLALKRARFRNTACGIAGIALVSLQLPAHFLFAEPAAEVIYAQPYMLASQIDHRTDLREIGLTPYDVSIRGILRPDEIDQAVQRLRHTGQSLRHSWHMPNPLPNLPRAKLLVVYDSLTDTPQTWVLAPEDMATPGISLIYLHYALTALGALLLAGPAIYLRHRKNIRPEISRSDRSDASNP